MATSKPRVIKDFEKLSADMQEAVKAAYPTGYFKFMVDYFDREGNKKSALPFETDEFFYLIKMPVSKPKSEEDEDGNGSSKSRRKSNDDFADLDRLGREEEKSEEMESDFEEF